MSTINRQHRMLDQVFSKLDISTTEAKIFLALADAGKSPASTIAKKLGLPRSTVYSALNSLITRGLVSEEQSSDSTYFIANQPEAFREMIKHEKEMVMKHLAEKERLIEEMLPTLPSLYKQKDYSVPKLQFFEGEKGVRAMLYEHCRAWQQSIESFDFTWWGYQDHCFVEEYREWLDFYWNSMKPKEKIWLFSNHSSIEKKLTNAIQRRKIKVVPKKYHVSSTIWVLGDYVITIMTRQKPHYAFQLKDPVFAANQRQIFQMLWDSRS